MTLLLKQIFMFFRLLNSDTGLNQLAAGMACGVILGFSPILSIQSLLVIFCCFFFRVQLGAAFISAFFFKFIAYLVDPLADHIGQRVLESASLQSLFVEMYNMPFVPLTRFNDSLVMGSGIIGFLLVIPLYFIFKIVILKYRATVVERFARSKAWHAWKATAVYKWYAKYDSLYG